jgi:hypothetical protein
MMGRDLGFILRGRAMRRALDAHLDDLRDRYPGREFTRAGKAREFVMDGLERERRKLRLPPPR